MQFGGKSLHLLALARSNMKIDVLARVNCILRFTFLLHSNFSVFVLGVAALLVSID